MKASRYLRVFGLGLLAISGCKGSLPHNDDVKGTLKLDGVPVADVRVMFLPQMGMKHDASNANAMTDEHGQFQLTSDNGKPGAVIGTHRVVVMQGRPTDGNRDGSVPRAVIPKAYGSIADTPLVVEIGADQHEYMLEMKSTP